MTFRAALVVLLSSALAAPAQTLPLVDEVDWRPFRAHCQDLLAGLARLKNSELSEETRKALASLLAEKAPANPRLAAQAVQKLLDPHCLIGVSINPESRVKAARGDHKAELIAEQVTHVLVKVQNDGGVTHPLSVESEQAVAMGRKAEGERWLEASVLNDRPFAKQLTGRTVEYRVIRLVARQSGRREATLAFDVGQGSQDLGFRAEVPILFRIGKK